MEASQAEVRQSTDGVDSTRKITGQDGEKVCKIHNTILDKITKPFNTGYFGDDGFLWYCKKCGFEEDAKRRREKLKEESEAKQIQINKRLENSMLSKRFQEKTFENYRFDHLGQSDALEKAKDFVDRLDEGLGMILSGSGGTGKNHLASAIVQEVISSKNKTALITTAMKIVRSIKESWRSDSPHRESEVIRSFLIPDVLVIDEVGVQYGSDTERLVLSEIVNDRYNEMRSTILLTNLTPEELESQIGQRIIERFKEGGSCIVMKWPSYRQNAQKN